MMDIHLFSNSRWVYVWNFHNQNIWKRIWKMFEAIKLLSGVRANVMVISHYPTGNKFCWIFDIFYTAIISSVDDKMASTRMRSIYFKTRHPSFCKCISDASAKKHKRWYIYLSKKVFDLFSFDSDVFQVREFIFLFPPIRKPSDGSKINFHTAT